MPTVSTVKGEGKRLDLVFILLAALLLAWGIVRSMERGEPAMRSWSTYGMCILVFLSALNSSLRSSGLAHLIMVVCGLFIAVVGVTAILATQDGTPFRLLAVAKAISFFGLLGIASWLQGRRPAATDQSGIGGVN